MQDILFFLYSNGNIYLAQKSSDKIGRVLFRWIDRYISSHHSFRSTALIYILILFLLLFLVLDIYLSIYQVGFICWFLPIKDVHSAELCSHLAI